MWWPNTDKDIEQITRKCTGCVKLLSNPAQSPFHPWEWPHKPWQRIHIDYAEPFLNTMFLVVIDAHTKWAEI